MCSVNFNSVNIVYAFVLIFFYLLLYHYCNIDQGCCKNSLGLACPPRLLIYYLVICFMSK